MNAFIKILKTFHYDSVKDLWLSLFPSGKYQLAMVSISLSTAISAIDKLFGLDAMAFIGFILIMALELWSGIKASSIKGEKFQSSKLSRFTFKAFYYMVLIAVPFWISNSYVNHGKHFMAELFEWLQLFLVTQIFFENLLSIFENLSVITGKDKTAWIVKIKDKITGIF
ncbi:MAG: hypothetical protein DI598_16785 [Pseudopedobacter saltans]|uniref:Holin n=1 Tax=Pseudopedobacter saltans TaxID=151895 RepID=A0A2W5GKI3_9SPHI|nr:MAG: hypothetical protein DI598_16785 [Pseudopedobacter saltans]